MQDFTLQQGDLPLLVSMPHIGTAIPDAIKARMTPAALQLADTDWHLPQAYGDLQALGVSCLQAHWSRYVVDLNRPPEDSNLYPGQDTTGLCPLDTFHKEALYLPDQAPDSAEVEARRERYWRPYHAALQAELARLQAKHGYALLWDAHSIASEVPRFFAGRLPDLNFGNGAGSACAEGMLQAVQQAAAASQYSQVSNGRFKGGYITRHYGQPAQRVHALQLEMAQIIYMDEQPPFALRPERVAQLQPLLQQLLQSALNWARAHA
ncbi:N-formylglutamate deformylase [Massilia sp. W12]|uniref:N-formylglutamate deformylase n=1 Tax=Massilia sp. W12 TaxID=3126507 RepID=UPI0030CA8421